VPAGTVTETSAISAMLAGRRGDTQTRCRLHLSDVTGYVGESVAVLEGGEVTLSNYRDNSWELSISSHELSGFSLQDDWVRLFMDVRIPGEAWVEFALGHYRFERPKGTWRRDLSTHDLTATSGESLMLSEHADRGYRAPAGTDILAEVRDLIMSFGVPEGRISFPPVTRTLEDSMFLDPLQNFSATDYLRIVNALLSAGGFYALFTDAEGRFRTLEMQDQEYQAEHVVYGNGTGGEGMVIGDVPYANDDASFANVVVVYAGDPTATTRVARAELRDAAPVPAATGTVYVVDPDHPGTVEKIGRRFSEVRLENLVSQTAADTTARTRLRRAAGLNEKIRLLTRPDPRRGPRENYGLELADDAGTTIYTGIKWNVTGWKLPLSGGAMEHELSRLAAGVGS
jgi:hypothetical protein